MSFKDFNMDMTEYNKQIKELEDDKPKEETKKEWLEPTDGEYECALMGLELGTNKAGDKLMLKGSFKILDGEFKNARLWINKVLSGTKNDAVCIKMAIDFLNTFGSEQEVEFTGDFDDLEKQVEIVFADTKNCTFVVNQQTNNNGFKNYFINDVFDN